jgi:hypothetical protein
MPDVNELTIHVLAAVAQHEASHFGTHEGGARCGKAGVARSGRTLSASGMTVAI